MPNRLVVLTDEEIEHALGGFAPHYVYESLRRKLRAALEQPEGITEEWREADGSGGMLPADVTELDGDLRAYLLGELSNVTELDGDLRAYLLGELSNPEVRYCTPWAALRREDGEGR